MPNKTKPDTKEEIKNLRNYLIQSLNDIQAQTPGEYAEALKKAHVDGIIDLLATTRQEAEEEAYIKLQETLDSFSSDISLGLKASILLKYAESLSKSRKDDE